MGSTENFEKFQALGRVRSFAKTINLPVRGQYVICGAVQVDISKYIYNNMKVSTICKWLQFMKEVVR